MRIEQTESSFQPVTITLQSQQEVDTFHELLNVAYRSSASGSDVERLAGEMRDDLNRLSSNGWESSSASC